MAVFEDEKRLNNIFRRIMSNEKICSKYDVSPGEYYSISQGKKSNKLMIKVLATSLQDIQKNMRSKGNNANELDVEEMKTIYRKIALLVTE